MKRAVVIQLVLFAVIAVGSAVYVAQTVLGPQALATPIRVVVRMPVAAGLAPNSQVTYRGIRVGTVSDVRFEDESSVRLELALDPGVRIPASARALISMDTPLGIQHLDLRATDEQPPFLRSGSVIEPEKTSRPLPLADLLVNFTELADSIDGRDIEALSDSLSTGLNGTEPELQRILDNTQVLVELAERHESQITNLLDGSSELLGSAEGTAGDLPELTASMRDLTGQVRNQEPAVRELLATAPRVMADLNRLLDENQQAMGTLLGNLLVVGETVGARTPALQEALVAVPEGLNDLASIVHGDIADFYLVGAQGPVCYYDTPRRTANETGPRELHTEWTCPAGEGLQQRGADSAPRPDGSAASHPPAAPYEPVGEQAAGPPGPETGPGPPADGNSVLGPRSWYSIMLRGVR